MTKKIAIGFVLLLLFMASHVPGQEMKFRHITPRDGLSSQFVKDIIRDSTGFMWFATSTGGLCRYDGYSFRTYRNIPGDSTSLSGDNVNCILEIKKNQFLLGTYFAGMNAFNAETEEFFHYRHDPHNSTSISSDRVNVIYRDANGTIWVGTHHGLNLFHPETGTFTSFIQFPDKSDHLSDQVNAILMDRAGTIWVGTNDGLFHFDLKSRSFRKFDLENNETLARTIEVSVLLQTHDSAIWVGTGYYLYILKDGKSNYISNQLDRWFSPSNSHVEDIVEFEIDGEYQLWLSTDWGLNRYHFDTKQYDRVHNKKDNPNALATGDLDAICYDGSGSLWISGWEHGVDVLQISSQSFIHQKDIKIIQDSINRYGYTASSFCEDSGGNLWVASHEAFLVKYDSNVNFVRRYRPTFPDRAWYPNGRVEKVIENAQNDLVLGVHTPRSGTYFLDKESGILNPIPIDTLPGQAPPQRFRDMLKDNQGNIWVGTNTGLFCIAADEAQRTMPFSIGEEVFPAIWDLMLDRSGNLWIASEEGLFEISGKNSTSPEFSKYNFNSKEEKVPNQYPRYLLESNDRTIWVGTNQSLCRVDQNNRIFYPADPSDSWVNENMIISIVEDKNGMLWMNSSKGLIKFDPKRRTGRASRLYDMSDGLPYDGYISTPLYLHPDGRIFVPANYGTQKGFYYFDPGQVPFNDHKPNIVITDFRIKNEDFKADSSISAVNTIILKHNQNFFTLDFAVLDFTDPSKNRYEYYLDGFEEDWNNSGTRHFANYTGVPPGSYVFRVRGSNNDGFWNETGAALSITILPPPWKTWWAIALYVIFTIGVLISIIWYYLKRQQLMQKLIFEQLSKEKLEELDTMKSRFFANISHEFRTPLTLILGPLQKMILEEKDEQKKQELTLMHRSAKQLHRLINQLLSLAKLESGKMKLQCARHDLVPLVRNYIQSFESLAKQKNIQLTFRADPDSIPCWADKDKIEQVLNNLLSNAFKFTSAGGEVTVEVRKVPPLVPPLLAGGDERGGNDEACVQLSISDTGTGINPTHLHRIFDRFYQADDSDTRFQEGSGIGLALTKELVELHHGEIRVESEVGKGTTFFVLLPLGREHLKEEELECHPERSEGQQPAHPLFGTSPPVPRFPAFTGTLERGKRGAGGQGGEAPLLLIVEDNPDMRYYIQSYFEKNFQVIEAGDGEKGILLAREHLPDIIVSDVMMPLMDGIEFCRKIKSSELTSHIPVVLLTAKASKESRLEGLETGADDFITKPFDGEELIIRVNNLITQRIRLKERFRKEFEKSPDMVSTARLSMDQQFLQKAIHIIEKHLSDNDFSIQHFAEEMALSRVQLHRKLTAIVNKNATDFIRMYRLNRAAGMIKQQTGTMAEIAYDVGFTSPSYFAECFKKQYGVSPTEFLSM